jgi:hypothetical protein
MGRFVSFTGFQSDDSNTSLALASERTAGRRGLLLLPHISGVPRHGGIDASERWKLRFEALRFWGYPARRACISWNMPLMVALHLLSTSPGEIVVLGVHPGSTDYGVPLTPPCLARDPLADRMCGGAIRNLGCAAFPG